MAATQQQYEHDIAPVDSREELLYLLSLAAEIEHGLSCVYLFATYSLKDNGSEGGLPDEYVPLVRSWKAKLVKVAAEEMLHLAQVTNLLTAIGGAPHFRRMNFPVAADAFPLGIAMTLEPFSRSLIERFICFEMPGPGILLPERQAEFDRLRDAACGPLRPCDVPRIRGTEPFDVDFHTVGELYRKIESGFQKIPQRRLFIGPPEAQAKAGYLDLAGELVAVVDRESAARAIDMIIKQGEAPTSEHPDAHFCVFNSIRIEFERATAEAKQRGLPFDAARPVVSNPMTRRYDDSSGGSLIADERALAVADVFNGSYHTMLLMLVRFFAHTDESEAELQALASATLDLMRAVLGPLGEALSKMPAGEKFAGMTAGAGFGYSRDIHLLPHKAAAWTFFGERLAELVARATALTKSAKVPPEVVRGSVALE
jgi:hypothetical protein